MPRSLKLYIAGVVTLSAVALVVATFVYEANPAIALGLGGILGTTSESAEILLGIAFWTGLTLIASALPVRLPMGTQQAVAMAPVLAAITLGGPAVGGWVAALGSTEVRELRARIPWYGTLANHAGLVLPAIAAGMARLALIEIAGDGRSGNLGLEFLATMVAAAVFFVLNAALAGTLLALRTGQPITIVIAGDMRETAFNNIAMGPLGWLMALVYTVQWWAALLFALPLYTTRMASQRFVEMREMFTQTIGALAEAVDKRDPYTARHSQRVKEIAVDIGKVMRVKATDSRPIVFRSATVRLRELRTPSTETAQAFRLATIAASGAGRLLRM